MKLYKRIVAILTCFILAFQLPVTQVEAKTTMQSLFDETVVLHGDAVSSKKAVYGVDVSHYQKTIDWKKVKAAGVEFAMLKIGGAYLKDGSFYKDATFEYNYKNARANGVKVGIYFFSQATNASEAKKEVNYVMKLLNGRKLDLPIAYDAEFGGSTSSKLYKAYKAAVKKGGTSEWKKQWTNIAKAFCAAVTSKGYKASFYGSISKVVNKINYTQIDSKYQMWIARYRAAGNTTPNELVTSAYPYKGSYEMWQYSDHGHVNGIPTGVDLDIMYVAKSNTTYKGCAYYNKKVIGKAYGLVSSVSGTTVKLSWSKAENATSYDLYRSENYKSGFKKIATVKTTSYSDAKRTYNKEYYYYVVPKGTVNGSASSGKKSSVIRCYASKTNLGRLKTTAKTYVYTEANTSTTKKMTLAKGKTMAAYASTVGTDGKVWFKVTVVSGKKQITGYVSSAKAGPVAPALSGLKVSAKAAKSISLTWNAAANVTGYKVYMATAIDGTYTKVGVVSASKGNSFTATDLSGNREYYFKVCAYKKVAGVVGNGTIAYIKAGTTQSAEKTMTAKTSCILRKEAGTSQKKLLSLSAGTKVTATYTTKDKSGKTWYKVKYVKSGKTYTGYIIGSRLV